MWGFVWDWGFIGVTFFFASVEWVRFYYLSNDTERLLKHGIRCLFWTIALYGCSILKKLGEIHGG